MAGILTKVAPIYTVDSSFSFMYGYAIRQCHAQLYVASIPKFVQIAPTT